MRLPVLLGFIAVTLSAQPITFGIKTGVPFIDPYGSAGDSSKLAGGGSVEVRLPDGFAIEASAIYRHTSAEMIYLPSNGIVSVGAFNHLHGNSWEFPIVGKYYFRPVSRRWQPFLGAGVAIRDAHVTSEGVTMAIPETGVLQTNPFRATDTNSALGGVLAAGVRIRSGRFALVPEFRVTRWGNDGFGIRRNDPGIYLGFTF